MTINQLTQVFTDMNDSDYGFGKWIYPDKISYIVLKDNSLLRTDRNLMFFFHQTEKLLYVASGMWDKINNVSVMPKTNTTAVENTDRFVSVIDFKNINNIVLKYYGTYLGGNY